MYSARVFRRKIPSLTSKNPITEGDLEWIFARNCEGTEQLRIIKMKRDCRNQKNLIDTIIPFIGFERGESMEALQALFHNKMFVAPFWGWCTAQILKTLLHCILNKEFNAERLVGSGGMPSSHSASVVGLMYATAYCKGVDGFEFPMAAIFALIVMYDAMNVRMETGKKAVILNHFLKNEEFKQHLKETDKNKWPEIILKEYVGHTPSQVLGGIVVGIIVGYLVCRFL